LDAANEAQCSDKEDDRKDNNKKLSIVILRKIKRSRVGILSFSSSSNASSSSSSDSFV
jgi:hypothetical protein